MYQHACHLVLEKFIAKLPNVLPNLFRFVTDPAIPTTTNNNSNAAERALRELVVHHKACDFIWSENALGWLVNLFTCVTTWKARSIDYTVQVARYI